MQILDKFPIEGGQKDPKKRIIPFLPGDSLLLSSRYLNSCIPFRFSVYFFSHFSFLSTSAFTNVFSSGWWFVSTAEEQGWVPATYLDSQNGTRDDLDLGTSRTVEGYRIKRGVHLHRRRSHWTSEAHQYLGKEGWAPASYLKKIKEDFSPRKKTLTGPVEIIGNIMEISNLLQKKSVSEKDIQTDGEGGTTPERHFSKSEISLPIAALNENKARGEPGSPAVARVAPHRLECNIKTRPFPFVQDSAICSSNSLLLVVQVIEKNPGGWWYVQIGEMEGWAPCSYIDKRKKPNLSRRSSTLTRPKVPPPAPPVKKQESEEAPPSANSSSKTTEVPSRAVYEEPEYDIPAVGCEGEPEPDPLKDERSRDASPPVCKASPVFAHRRTSFRSVEEVAKEECIYENDGFRPSGSVTKGSSEPNSPRSYHSSTVPRKPSGSSPLPGRPMKTMTPEMSRRSQTLGRHIDISFRSQDNSPHSSSDELSRGSKKGPVFNREVEQRIGQSPSTRPKPSVRPKPLLTKSEPQSPERMDITSLRRQLRPTSQFRHSLKPSRGEDSETASVISSEDSVCSRSTSDLSSVYSKGSRGDSDVEGPNLYRSVDAYKKVQDSEISFPAGAEVEVLEKQESGWWYIRWGSEEGWAPSYYLEAVRQMGDGGGLDGHGSGGSKSNSLEKNEQHVLALNNINIQGLTQQHQGLRRNSPPIPSKPPGGFSKPSGMVNGGVRMRNGVRQVAVRPQSVFVTTTQPAKDAHYTTGSLRRNESLGRSDHYGSGSATLGVRRNASFSTVRPHVVVESQTRPAERSSLSSGSAFSTSNVQDALSRVNQRNGIPVSTVRPKPLEKSQLIHNNLGRDVYVSIADYHGDEETMGFTEGTCLEVLERNPNGWWYCQVQDSLVPRKGWVPSNYLERKK
uniref:SH3 and PX domains 2Aa n=1 Tax=Neolamprologus brichardi TaxID=32507 RepID=A0A3Q4HUY9_NEOBR